MTQPPGLRIRMLLLGVAILLPILALLGYQTWYYTQTQIADQRDQATYLVSLVAQEAESQLALQQKVLQTLAMSPALLRPLDAQACRQTLAGGAAIHESLSRLALYAANGRALCAAGHGATPDDDAAPDVANQDYFRDALRLRKPTLSDHVVNQPPGRSSIAFAVPSVAASGNDVGTVLVAWLDLDWLDRAMNRLPTRPGTNIVVVDGKGTILTPQRWQGCRCASKNTQPCALNFTQGL